MSLRGSVRSNGLVQVLELASLTEGYIPLPSVYARNISPILYYGGVIWVTGVMVGGWLVKRHEAVHGSSRSLR